MNEPARLARLGSYGVMDTAPDRRFDRLTALAANLLDTPIAPVSLLDQDRQWFKSRYGLEVSSTPRSQAFCAHVPPLGPEGLLVVEDATQDRIDWSDAVYAIHGVARDSFEPSFENGVEFFHTDDRPRLAAFLDQVRQADGDLGYQLRLQRRDGALRQVACHARCERDDAGRPKALFGVFQDVTEHMEAVARAEAKTEFLANMSHDLRAPITSIIGFTKLTLQDPALSELSRR